MRASVTTRLALAAATAVAAAGLVSCSSTIGGTAVCPGCGTNAEPSFPKPTRTPTAAPEPGLTPTPPTPGATAAPSPGGTPLPTNERGFAYIETKSGKTRCQLNRESVGCESQFENSPQIDGESANGVSVSAAGEVHWLVGNLGDIPTVTLGYGTYSAAGWTINAGADGTRFTNDGTGHGMFVAVEGVTSF